jgi:hypothetical protein
MRRISPMAVEEVIEMQGLSLDPSSHRVMTGEKRGSAAARGCTPAPDGS